jgi:hypothetical protein
MKRTIDITALENLLDQMITEQEVIRDDLRKIGKWEEASIYHGVSIGLWKAKYNLYQVTKYSSEETVEITEKEIA